MNKRAFKQYFFGCAMALSLVVQSRPFMRSSSVIAVGEDPTVLSSTFEFEIGAAVYDASFNQLWSITSSTKDSDYALAVTPLFTIENPSAKQLVSKPMTPENVQLTTYAGDVCTTTKIANPLRQEGFDTLYMKGYDVLVAKTGTDHLYQVTNISFASSGDSNNTARVYKYSADTGYTIAGVASALSGIYTFETNGTFGADLSRICLIGMYTRKGTSGATEQYLWNYTNGLTGNPASVSISTASPFLTAQTTDLASLGSFVCTTNSNIGVYAGFSGTAASSSGAVCSPVVLVQGKIVTETKETVIENKSTLQTVSVLDNAVAGAAQDSLLTAGIGHQIRTKALTCMNSSTGISYLLVATDTGDSTDLRVGAFPLVSLATDTTKNGLIADLDSYDKRFTTKGVLSSTAGFTAPLTDTSKVSQIQSNAATLVGGGNVPFRGTISNMYTIGDRVYLVSPTDYDANQQPGIFGCQALFDAQGLIAGWTPWVRVGGTDAPLLYAMHDATTNKVVCAGLGSAIRSPALATIISQSVWGATVPSYQQFIDITSSWSSTGGVQGLFSFSPQQLNANMSLVVATGYNKVAIAQTGSTNADGILQPLYPVEIKQFDLSNLNLGAIVSAAIAHDDSGHNWLVVGGSGGLAVLNNSSTGYGWADNETDFAVVTAGTWTAIPYVSTGFVKKIIAQDGYIFCLTPWELVQLEMNVDTVLPIQPVRCLIAQSADYANALFTDMVVCQKDGAVLNKIILGTTNGLYMMEARQAATPVKINRSTSILPVTSLVVQSNDTIDFTSRFGASGTVANLYVLSADYAADQAAVERFTIAAGSGSNPLTVVSMQDQLVEGEIDPVVVFNEFKNSLYIDPAGWYASVFATPDHAITYTFLNGNLVAGSGSVSFFLNRTYAATNLQNFKNQRYIANTVRDYATGALWIGGSFGLMVNS